MVQRFCGVSESDFVGKTDVVIVPLHLQIVNPPVMVPVKTIDIIKALRAEDGADECKFQFHLEFHDNNRWYLTDIARIRPEKKKK